MFLQQLSRLRKKATKIEERRQNRLRHHYESIVCDVGGAGIGLPNAFSAIC
jgi:hypothetical protein